MPKHLKDMFRCFKSSGGGKKTFDELGETDRNTWSINLGRHFKGDFSFAVVKANHPIEDCSQVEVGRSVTFIGVYDGHGGPDASHFVLSNLLKRFTEIARESESISEEVIKKCIASIEDMFLEQVRREMGNNPRLVEIGSCCLVGIICEQTLYVANLGDARAVLGYINEETKTISALQLTVDHNANRIEIRNELEALHPDDPNIVLQENGSYRVKGIIQVSRAIGDAYMKREEFALSTLAPRHQIREPRHWPILSAEPSISTRELLSRDRFLIFASDGLWDFIQNQEAVEIVQRYPRNGIARRLIRIAVERAAANYGGMEYAELTSISHYSDNEGYRRKIHDDITVIVVFIDPVKTSDSNTKATLPEISVHGCGTTTEPSQVSSVNGLSNASSSSNLASSSSSTPVAAASSKKFSSR